LLSIDEIATGEPELERDANPLRAMLVRSEALMQRRWGLR
jgi:hypothetical protein